MIRQGMVYNEDESGKQLDKLLLLGRWQFALSVSNVVETGLEYKINFQ